MKPRDALYVVTGAEGFLGGWVVKNLLAQGAAVRALVFPETPARLLALGCAIRRADVREPADLTAAFKPAREGQDVIVIHTAGIVSIAGRVHRSVYDTNVIGTQNVIDACRATSVRRLVYVSSVHAIPEAPVGATMTEVERFDPELVRGEYARTKAEATRRVLAAEGLQVVVVHPSGLIGPEDPGRGHFTQLIRDALSGRLPATVGGGYDFVDVRDVAAGCVAAAQRGRPGACYLLTGEYVRISTLVGEALRLGGRRWRLPRLPNWLARLVAPALEAMAAARGVPPSFTAYSLATLTANARFSHALATIDLDFAPRDWRSSLADLVGWLAGSSKPMTR